MLSKTVSIIAANWWVYLFFVVILLVLSALSDAGVIGSGNNAGTGILWLFFARYVHRTALFGAKFTDRDAAKTYDRGFVGFVLKGLALTFVPMIFAIPILIWTRSGSQNGPMPSDYDVVRYACVFVTLFILSLSIAGTWMPASIYRQNTSLQAAVKRGLRYFFRILAWVAPSILAPCLAIVSSIILAFALHSDLAVIESGALSPVNLAIIAANFLVQSLAMTLVSVVLCHYYLKGEGVDAGVFQPTPASA